MNPSQPEQTAEIEIQASKPLHDIDPRIYGHFIEHLGMCIENGIWSYEDTPQPMAYDRVREDVLGAIRALKPPVLRWPGGCFSDGYHWMDGIGPRDKRPVRFNLAWGWQSPKLGPRERNHFGVDEFLRLCREIGAEPLINVNLGTGTPREAARLVQYLNGPEDSAMGALRVLNGHPKPYNVRLFGIGNELWGPHEIGWCPTGGIYARRFLRYFNAMAAMDPDIKCMAVGGLPLLANWNRDLLRLAADKIGFLSLHCYAPELDLISMNVIKGMEKDEKTYKSLAASSKFFEDRLRWCRGSVEEALGPDTQLPIAFDEWNLWWTQKQIIRAEDYTLRDGIAIAATLNVLQRLPWVKMANFAQLVNTIGMIITNREGLYVTPSYLAMKLCRDVSGSRLLASRTRCGTFDTESLGGIPAYRDLPLLDVSATADPDGQRVALFIVNRSFGEPVKTTVSLQGFTPGPEARVYSISSPSPFDGNSFAEPDKIKTLRQDVPITSQTLEIPLPPHSIHAVEWIK